MKIRKDDFYQYYRNSGLSRRQSKSKAWLSEAICQIRKVRKVKRPPVL